MAGRLTAAALALALMGGAQPVTAQTAAPTPPPTPAQGLAAVQARLAATDHYAGVYGLTRGGESAVGVLGDHAVDEAWRWASVSKMINAILTFRQIDAGRVALDAPVAAYLAGTSVPNADRITLRQLLGHRSGLAGQSDLPDGPPGDLLQYCGAVAAEPGAVFLYNNCDTIVLGAALEAVTGLAWIDLVNRDLAAPLGVGLTVPDEPRVEAIMEDGADEPPVWPSGYGAAGGLYGSAGALLTIDAALMDGRLMSAGSLETMLTGDPASGYAALGVWSWTPDLGACIGRTRLVERYGEIGGVQVRNFLLPDLELALVVYSNDHGTVFGEVWRGEGLSIDLIRAAACGATAPA
jgi:D-alanyl-D-alanine carboxypeptidase